MKHHLPRTLKNVASSLQSDEVAKIFLKLLDLKKNNKEKIDERRNDVARAVIFCHENGLWMVMLSDPHPSRDMEHPSRDMEKWIERYNLRD